jgi:hypothetical protein
MSTKNKDDIRDSLLYKCVHLKVETTFFTKIAKGNDNLFTFIQKWDHHLLVICKL